MYRPWDSSRNVYTKEKAKTHVRYFKGASISNSQASARLALRTETRGCSQDIRGCEREGEPGRPPKIQSPEQRILNPARGSASLTGVWRRV